MAEYFDVDRITNDQTGDVFHLKDYSLDKAVSSPAPIVSFPDGAPYPIGLTAAIDPVQDLHGYANPWPGGGSKNLFDQSILATWRGIYTVTNGIVIVNFTDSMPETGESYFFSLPAGTFTMSITNNARLQISWDGTKQKDVSNTNKITFTLSEARSDIHIKISASSYPFTAGTVQIESGSEATAYVPYSNICPITGFDGAKVTVTGKNLFDKTHIIANYYINGNYPYGLSSSANWNVVDYFKVYAGEKLIVSGNSSNYYIIFYDKDKLPLREKQRLDTGATVPNGAYYARFDYKEVDEDNLQLEIGTTASTYESPAITTYFITLPSAAGTVYGGTVTVNPDGTGTLVVDWVEIDLGNCQWQKRNNNYSIFFAEAAGRKYSADRTNLICSQYATEQFSAVDNLTDMHIGGSNSNEYFYIRDTRYTDKNTFAAAMSGVQLVYELATPITYILTPGQVFALLGANNVLADTGDIKALSYVRNTVPEIIRQDTAGQIASALDPVESSLAIVIDGDVAVGGLASGKYVFLRSHSTLARGLYHTTAAIAAGASITSSNVSADAEGAANAIGAITDEYIDTSTISITKIGKIAILTLNQFVVSNIGSGNSAPIKTLGDGYKPIRIYRGYASVKEASTGYVLPALAAILNNGKLVVNKIQSLTGTDYVNVENNDSIIGQIVYVLA